ncbi:MAG TPA: S1 RNA-binding domain-containing protein [Anaerolineaceae bacterium]|jgi:ribosomal protein S1
MESSVLAADDRSEVKPKQHFTGTVVKTTLAGAIVDLGLAVPGVIHISQMQAAESDQPVKRVDDLLHAGDTVEVWVRKVKDDRVELTMNKPLDLEWREIKKGMNVKGKVTRLEKFGAFVDIGAERPGLIHISELAHGYVRTPSEVVNEGDEVEAQVLDVNRRKKQIKLSLKALQEIPVKEEPVRMIETVAGAKPNRRRKGGRQDSASAEYSDAEVAEPTAPAEADPTAMEIALREAMERAKERKKQASDKKHSKAVSQEQEDILARTLEQKARGQ